MDYAFRKMSLIMHAICFKNHGKQGSFHERKSIKGQDLVSRAGLMKINMFKKDAII